MASGGRITSEKFASILTRLKAELARRKYVGSLEAYAEQTNFANPITSGSPIKTDAINTLLQGLEYINSSGLPSRVATGDKIYENQIDAIDLVLAAREATNVGGTTDCAASCSGLCSTSCTGACTSCTGTCVGGCSSCTGGCSGCSGCYDCRGCGPCSGCGSGYSLYH